MTEAPGFPVAGPHPRHSWITWALLVALVIAIWELWLLRPPAGTREAAPRAVTPRGDLGADEKSTIAVFRDVSPSVVHITTLAVRQNGFTFDLQQIPQGTGSGFVWDQDGHIVTNFHVIQGADAATVTLSDRSSWKAKLIGAYPDKDLAVLWVEAPKDRLHPIMIGGSQDLQVGQKVFAIGNPFGLDQSLTTGIISALGREIQSVTRRPIRDVIQTDAAINPGNSGGPLLDSAGRLIGVNTAIFSPSGTFAGIGFAIPVDEVNRIVPQLIRHGKVIRPGLGVQVAPNRLAEELGVKGVLILAVQPDSPAAKVGLRPTRWNAANLIELGDAIVAIDQQPIGSLEDLFSALAKHELGDEVQVTVDRNGTKISVDVTLESLQ
jgi:S1-C subfamily serine protease